MTASFISTPDSKFETKYCQKWIRIIGFSKCNHLSSYSGPDYTDHALFGFACYFLALPLEFGLRPREKEKRKKPWQLILLPVISSYTD